MDASAFVRKRMRKSKRREAELATEGVEGGGKEVKEEEKDKADVAVARCVDR